MFKFKFYNLFPQYETLFDTACLHLKFILSMKLQEKTIRMLPKYSLCVNLVYNIGLFFWLENCFALRQNY